MKQKIVLYILLFMSSTLFGMEESTHFSIAPKNTLPLSPAHNSPQPSLNSSTEISPKNLSKEERREQIRRNVAPLAGQFAEADAAQRALEFLRSSDSGTTSPLEGGSSSQNSSASGSGHITKPTIEITYSDGTKHSDHNDVLTKLPSDGTIQNFLSTIPHNNPSVKEELQQCSKIEVNPIKTETFFQQHPIFTTITGVGISFAALLILLYYMNRLPNHVTQLFDIYVLKQCTDL